MAAAVATALSLTFSVGVSFATCPSAVADESISMLQTNLAPVQMNPYLVPSWPEVPPASSPQLLWAAPQQQLPQFMQVPQQPVPAMLPQQAALGQQTQMQMPAEQSQQELAQAIAQELMSKQFPGGMRQQQSQLPEPLRQASTNMPLSQVVETMETVEKLKQKADGLEEELNEARGHEKELDKMASSATSQSRVIDDNARKLAALAHASVDQAQQSMDDQQTVMNQVKARLNALQGEKESWMQEKAKLQGELDMQKKEDEHLQDQLSRTEQSLADFQKQKQDWQKQKQEMTADMYDVYAQTEKMAQLYNGRNHAETVASKPDAMIDQQQQWAPAVMVEDPNGQQRPGMLEAPTPSTMQQKYEPSYGFADQIPSIVSKDTGSAGESLPTNRGEQPNWSYSWLGGQPNNQPKSPSQ